MILQVYKTIIDRSPVVVTAYTEHKAKEVLCEKYDRKRVKLEKWGTTHLYSAGYDYVSINEQPNLEHYNFNFSMK